MEEIDRRTALRTGAVLALSACSLGPLARAPRASAAVPTTDPAVVGRWSAPFDMGGVAIHATLVRTGEVLFFQYVEGAAGVDHTSYVGTWNHRTGVSAEAPLPYHRDVFCAGNSVLADGRVFIAGGHDHTTGKKQDPVGVAETDTFDPVTRTWTPGPLLSQKRWYPTTVQLGNGRVLVFGGQVGPGVPSDVVDEYDPATGTIRPLPATAAARLWSYPRMHLMADGRLLRTGVARQTTSFDPATNLWSSVAPMLHGARVRGSSVLLPGGTRVLTVGGQSSGSAPPTGTAEILDTSAATPRWRATGSLNIPRILAQTVLLPDGKLLVVGGGTTFKYTGPVRTPEMYSPHLGAWTRLAPQQGSRMYHATAVLLPDGRVLSAGQDNGTLARYGEIFSPPYLFKGARPTITASPATIGYGQALTVTTAQSAGIGRVVLMRAGSITHQVDSDQRAVPLTFDAGSRVLTARMTSNRNLAPPGYYMLFIVTRTGIPSVARWIRVG